MCIKPFVLRMIKSRFMSKEILYIFLYTNTDRVFLNIKNMYKQFLDLAAHRFIANSRERRRDSV